MSFTIIQKSKLNQLIEEISRKNNAIATAKSFIKSIGQGNLNAIYQNQEGDNELGEELLAMQQQMRKIAQADKEKNWTTEGMALFMQILRNDSGNLSVLAERIVSHLVKYLDANQGALFMVNDDIEEDVHLNMLSCYAYQRKKYLTKKIYPGEGSAGQAWLEKDTIYLTDIPREYTHITSGLGHATPREVLIVPLKNNEQILGIVELASFQKFEPYQIAFIEKLGESIANTISMVKVNEVTRRLLAESQQQTEEMKAQEEEMRQNVEELSATQEAQARLETELKNRLTELENARQELENIRKEEAEKTSKQMELQNKIMTSTINKFKTKETELQLLIQEKDDLIKQLSERVILQRNN